MSYDLLHDAVSSSNCTVWNCGMINQ